MERQAAAQGLKLARVVDEGVTGDGERMTVLVKDETRGHEVIEKAGLSLARAATKEVAKGNPAQKDKWGCVVC